jgi:hypothetical protein
VNRAVWTMLALAVIGFPRAAAGQQSFVNLFAGKTLTSASVDSADRGNTGGSDAGFGIAFGSLGKMVSAETEFAYFPQVFDSAAVARSFVVSVSGNILIGPTIGPAKIYGAIGVGDLYVNAAAASTPTSIAMNYLTLNGGAGVVFFFWSHAAVRADLRYYRATGFLPSDLERVGVEFERLALWRPTVGLTLKF